MEKGADSKNSSISLEEKQDVVIDDKVPEKGDPHGNEDPVWCNDIDTSLDVAKKYCDEDVKETSNYNQILFSKFH